MQIIKIKKRQRNKKIKVYHWSHAEVSSYNKAIKRHGVRNKIFWVDLLKVFKNEPITIKGCKNFSLKSVARTLKEHGYIKTMWDNTYADGMAVLVSIGQNNNINNASMIYDIIKYNEIDCKVLSEILEYLRTHI